jgi:hypothetical protein
MFNKKARKHLRRYKDKKRVNIDLYADGMAMILRLLYYLKRCFPTQEFVSVEEIKSLNESARQIQTYICNNEIDLIKKEFAKFKLQGCFPIIKDRVVFSRNWWIVTYGST